MFVQRVPAPYVPLSSSNVPSLLEDAPAAIRDLISSTVLSKLKREDQNLVIKSLSSHPLYGDYQQCFNGKWEGFLNFQITGTHVLGRPRLSPDDQAFFQLDREICENVVADLRSRCSTPTLFIKELAKFYKDAKAPSNLLLAQIALRGLWEMIPAVVEEQRVNPNPTPEVHWHIQSQTYDGKGLVDVMKGPVDVFGVAISGRDSWDCLAVCARLIDDTTKVPIEIQRELRDRLRRGEIPDSICDTLFAIL
jgi:hypothetical protein